MNLSIVIQQIRTLVPAFGGRVGGALDYFRAKDQGFLEMPAAYVIPLDDEVPEERDQTGYSQAFTERVAVIVVVSNTAAVADGDRRGQTAAAQIDAFKWALFRALVNWRPNSVLDNPDASLDGLPGVREIGQRGLYYAGGQPLEPDMARSFFQFTFALDVTITDEDAWQPGADPLEGVDIWIVDYLRVGEQVGDDLETTLAGEKIDLQA